MENLRTEQGYSFAEDNPEPPVTRRPSRHTYATVSDFTCAVDNAHTAEQLNKLANALRLGAGTYAGIHPWKSYDPDYKACWKLLFNRSNALGLKYIKGARFPFQSQS